MLDCKFFNFPTIPSDLIAGIKSGELIGSYPERVCTRGQEQFKTSPGCYYYVNSEIEQWVQNNLAVDIDFVGIRYQYGTADQCCHGAHSDATRSYALLYTIDNASGYLQFWKDPNLPLELDRGYIVHDYTNLIPLQQYQTPDNTWYLVNGQIIHSVEQLTRTRVTLQVNLKSLKGIDL